MGLFKKKEETQEQSKVAKLLELFNSLSDEELEEFLNEADLDGDGDVDENDTEAEQETVEGANEQTPEQTVEQTTEQEMPEQEETPEQEVEEPVTEETAEEAPMEETTQEAPQEPEIEPETEPKQEDIGTDKFQALQSQIDTLKETIEGLVARIEADQENKEEEQEPFGIGMQNTGKETDNKSDVQKAKEKYLAF